MTSTGDGTIYKSTSYRAPAPLVERARAIFDAQNLSMSAAITLFLEACVHEGRIPDAVMHPGCSSPNSGYVNAVLRSVTSQLHLPDFGNPLIPAEAFVEEIVLEFADSIFCDYHDPWIEVGDTIMDISSWDPEDEATRHYLGIDYYADLIPKKLPYDYARGIVEVNTKAWAEAERKCEVEIDSPYDAMMGKLLKRSHLTLDELMDELVEAGAVEEKDGPDLNRSKGKMAEDLVAYLKEIGLWDAPKPMCGVPFKEVKEGLIDEVIDDTVAFRVKSDCTRYLAYGHPIGYMFEDLSCSMNLAIENTYIGLFDMDEFEALDSDIDLLELEDTTMSLFNNCQFKYPPKVAYDECVKRYLDAMENAEPGTVAAKCRPYATAPFDYKQEFLYPIAIDIDIDLWAELYNREAFFTTVQAVRDGVLPEPGSWKQ